MLSFKEVNELLEKNYKELKELQVKYEQNEKEYLAMMDGMTLKEKFEYRKSNREKLDEKIKLNGILAEQINDLIIERKLLLNNAYITLSNEIVPIGLEVLMKYKGKPYGEKTREKISKEMIDRVNFGMYINNGELRFYGLKERQQYSFTVYPKYLQGKRLLIENKIQEIEVEDLSVSGVASYIENTKERVEELKIAYNKVAQAKKQLEDLCNEFNELKVNGIETLSIYNIDCIRDTLTYIRQ